MRKFPLSQGPKGNLDSRRWVIITIRNNGAQEAQFPLPVTVNTQRIAFDRDEPVIAPAYYLDTLDNTILPKYEEIPQSQKQGRYKDEDQARLVELKYHADISEIEDKYQTCEAIMEFAKLLRTEECPTEYEQFKNRSRLGQVSFNRHNYEWSKQMEAKLNPNQAPKIPERKIGPAANTK